MPYNEYDEDDLITIQNLRRKNFELTQMLEWKNFEV